MAGKLFWKDEEVLETEKLSLKGKHNLENTLFIVSAGKLCGIENSKIREFLYNTKTLEHRMEDFSPMVILSLSMILKEQI